MEQQSDQSTENIDERKNALDKRLEAIGWALFLIMIGGLWLAPEGFVPEGTWLIGTGVIIVGLMILRYLYGIKVNAFWLVLGIVALAFGISSVFGLNIPVLPILIIIIGINIILKPFLQKK
jgi:hypothetical protein